MSHFNFYFLVKKFIILKTKSAPGWFLSTALATFGEFNITHVACLTFHVLHIYTHSKEVQTCKLLALVPSIIVMLSCNDKGLPPLNCNATAKTLLQCKIIFSRFTSKGNVRVTQFIMTIIKSIFCLWCAKAHLEGLELSELMLQGLMSKWCLFNSITDGDVQESPVRTWATPSMTKHLHIIISRSQNYVSCGIVNNYKLMLRVFVS